MSELPFMATENIMMDAVKAGGDRQELHERIRELSMEAGKNVKVEGKDNNLLELIAADPAFNLTLEDLQKSMDPSRYTGPVSYTHLGQGYFPCVCCGSCGDVYHCQADRKCTDNNDAICDRCDILSVSYTHLDVYKRQVLWRDPAILFPDRR